MKKAAQSKTDHASYYDDIAEGYNELHGEEQRTKYRIIAHELDLPDGASVLDVGAGTGIGNEFFPSAVGIDPSSKLLQQHPHPKSIVGSAEQLPFPDNTFDAVLCVSALHHTNYKQAISEMVRVSRHWIALTVLKKSPKADPICSYAKKTLHPNKIIEEDKDWILLARKA